MEKVKIKKSELEDMYDIEEDVVVEVQGKKKGLKVEGKVEYIDHADELEKKLEEEFDNQRSKRIKKNRDVAQAT